MGLYLEQVTKYVSDSLEPLGQGALTGSMVSNYVKKGILASPVRKQYNREQIAQLIFIAVAKMVMSMDDLHLMLEIQQKTYPSQVAYDYFRQELIAMLEGVFGLRSEPDAPDASATDEKIMLRNMIVTAAHRVYLNKLFAVLRAETPPARTE